MNVSQVFSKKAFISSVFIFVVPTMSYAEVSFPEIKAGLWETTTKDSTKPEPEIVKICMGKGGAKKMVEAASKMMGGTCSDLSYSKKGDAFVSNVKCDIGPIKMNSSSVMSGDFQKHYTVKTTTKIEPAMMGNGGGESVGEAKYIGECAEGMKPGDATMADGKTINVYDMMDEMSGKMAESMEAMSEVMKNMPKDFMEKLPQAPK